MMYNNNTNVYACKLDASKAFDRVHYGTLFEMVTVVMLVIYHMLYLAMQMM